MMRKLWSGMILLSVWSILYAANQEKAIENCFGQANSTHDYRRCNEMAYSYYDHQLNAAYAALIKKLPKEEVSNLRRAQRVWLEYRDKECYFEGYEMRGGSAEYSMIVGCKADMTKRRANELKHF